MKNSYPECMWVISCYLLIQRSSKESVYSLIPWPLLQLSAPLSQTHLQFTTLPLEVIIILYNLLIKVACCSTLKNSGQLLKKLHLIWPWNKLSMVKVFGFSWKASSKSLDWELDKNIKRSWKKALANHFYIFVKKIAWTLMYTCSPLEFCLFQINIKRLCLVFDWELPRICWNV